MLSPPIRIALLVVASLSIAFVADAKDEPTKPLSYWIGGLASDQTETRQAANDALNFYEEWLYEPPHFVGDGNPWAERDRLRSELKPHISSLTNLLNGKHADSRLTATGLLGLIGHDATSAGTTLLEVIRAKETPDDLLISAAVTLMHVTPADKPVGPMLLEVYTAKAHDRSTDDDDDDGGLDNVAGSGIAAVFYCRLLISSGRTMIEVPTLVELAGPRFKRLIRAIAITVLAELGSESKAAIPGLRKLLTEEDLQLRKAIAAAILNIEGDPKQIKTIAMALNLSDEDRLKFEKSMSEMFEETERQQKSVLALDPEDSPGVISMLVQQLKYGLPIGQRQAIRTLAEFGPRAKDAIPELTVATKNPDAATRQAAVAALKQIKKSLRVKNE